MDEIYIKLKDLNAWDFKYIQEYFNNKDMICLIDILNALEYEIDYNNKLTGCVKDELRN